MIGKDRCRTYKEVIEKDIKRSNDEKRVGRDAHQALRLEILFDEHRPAISGDTEREPSEVVGSQVRDLLFFGIR